MGGKYYCVVNKDHKDNELRLQNASEFDTLQPTADGTILFSDRNQMNSYFNQYCVSEKDIENGGGGCIFMMLFFLLLIILLISLSCQMFNKSKNPGSATGFGRFNF